MGLFGKSRAEREREKLIEENKKIYFGTYDREKWSIPWESFNIKVSGVTFINEDTGTDRQLIIEATPIGEKLMLIAEDDNKYDDFAVRVVRFDGFSLGYIPSSHNRDLWKDLMEGKFIDAELIDKPFYNNIYGAVLKLTKFIEKEKNDIK